MLICFCEEPMALEMGTGKIFATRCGHMFHDTCIIQWIAKSETCPQCRSVVTETEMIPLYPALYGEDEIQDLNEVLQSCLESLEDTKFQLEHMTAVCNDKDETIQNLKNDAERCENVQRQLTAMCREKDSIIANLEVDMDRLLKRQANEIFENLMQMLDGLKGFATKICKTVDKSTPLDLMTQTRTETDLSVAEASVIESRVGPTNTDESVTQLRGETTHTDVAVTQPRGETTHDDSVTQPCATSVANANVSQLEMPETSDTTIAVTQSMAATSNTVVTQPVTESSEADVELNDTIIESSDIESVLTQPETGSSDNAAVSQSQTESNNQPTDAEATESLDETLMTESTNISAGATQPSSESQNAAVTQQNTGSRDVDETTMTENNNIYPKSTVDAEIAVIKSSVNTLERTLIRILEIKNSTEDDQ